MESESEESRIYEVTIGNRRYFAVMVGDIEVTVRIPLHVFNSKKPHLLEPYADELIKVVAAEKRRQGPWNKKNSTSPQIA